eukprot:g3166.t1
MTFPWEQPLEVQARPKTAPSSLPPWATDQSRPQTCMVFPARTKFIDARPSTARSRRGRGLMTHSRLRSTCPWGKEKLVGNVTVNDSSQEDFEKVYGTQHEGRDTRSQISFGDDSRRVPQENFEKVYGTQHEGRDTRSQISFGDDSRRVPQENFEKVYGTQHEGRDTRSQISFGDDSRRVPQENFEKVYGTQHEGRDTRSQISFGDDSRRVPQENFEKVYGTQHEGRDTRSQISFGDDSRRVPQENFEKVYGTQHEGRDTRSQISFGSNSTSNSNNPRTDSVPSAASSQAGRYPTFRNPEPLTCVTNTLSPKIGTTGVLDPNATYKASLLAAQATRERNRSSTIIF